VFEVGGSETGSGGGGVLLLLLLRRELLLLLVLVLTIRERETARGVGEGSLTGGNSRRRLLELGGEGEGRHRKSPSRGLTVG
jgi:hypothetical protein